MSVLDSKDPAEFITITFDFAALTSATLTGAVVTASVESGKDDASPSAIVSGAAQVSGLKVLQRIIGGQAGTNYLLRCQVDAGTERFVLSSILPVQYSDGN